MAREFLRITPETTPGTYNASGTPTIIDIDKSNAYTVRPKPITVDTMTAGAFNRRAIRTSKKTSLEGTLNWLMHGSQATVFVNWAIAASNVLTSYTIDYCVTQEDSASTMVYSRDLGMYVAQAQLTSGEQDQIVRAYLQLAGMQRTVITATDFPTPAITAYPSDAILTFEDASGGLTLHGTNRLDFETFTMTVKNFLDTRFFVSQWPQKIKYCGRTVDISARLAFGSSIPRADYEAQTAINAGITFNNSVHSLALNLNSKNYYGDIVDQIDHSKVFLNNIELNSFVDTSVGDELSASAS